MARVLLAQEFGSNLGHLNRLVAVGRRLDGHALTVVTPDVALARPVVASALGAGVPVLERPAFDVARPPRLPNQPDRTLADVFFQGGFADAGGLLRRARAWRVLVEDIEPDLVVGDFAPFLRLATWDRFPVVVASEGYCVPPLCSPLPPVRPDVAPDPASVAREAALLESANRVRGLMGGPPLACFAELFWGERTFPVASRLSDPYHGMRPMAALPPVTLQGMRCGPPHAERTGPAIFLYLWAAHPALDALLSALNGIARPIQVHVRGIDPEVLARQCAPQLSVWPVESDFRTLLPQTRLFIHYGGAGATAAALAAGTLQLVLPTNLEQEATAVRLAEGCGGAALALVVVPGADVGALRGLIEGVLDDPGRQAAALRVAREVAAEEKGDTVGTVVAACRELLDRRARRGRGPAA